MTYTVLQLFIVIGWSCGMAATVVAALHSAKAASRIRRAGSRGRWFAVVPLLLLTTVLAVLAVWCTGMAVGQVMQLWAMLAA